jgi:radical SAM-linked protein
MRFISHLDVQRLFKRALRRAGIELVYSQGYNPHPKINIVQPLSLGFESKSDYFEIATAKEQDIASMISALNEALPDGIMFKAGKELPDIGKNLSSFVDFAEYEVFLPYKKIEGASKYLNNFILQSNIMVNKRSKKTKSTVSTDVTHLVRSIRIHSSNNEGLFLNMILRSASNESLNPLNILEAFCEFSSETYSKENCHVMRKDLFFMKEENLISLFEYIVV